LAAEELQPFKELGGRTVIDVTSRGLGPRPLDLRSISEKTNLNIIASCGYSVGRSHPSDMSTRSVDEIADEMIRDITEGIAGTDVRAGIIGELGTSYPITDNERKVLRAAAHAHKNTGVAVNVHFNWRGRQAPKVLDLLESEGVDPAKIVLDHQDGTESPTSEYFVSLAQRGAFVAFDGFGEEHYNDEMRHAHPRDVDRVKFVARLVEEGYVNNILLSHDIAHKNHYRRFGGHGYGHILRTIVPMLRELSVTDAEIRRILVDNPMRSVA
jgi:phosphotriesterase-related protein